MKRILLILSIALASHAPSYAGSLMTPSNIRALEIRKDELPKSIDAEQLSVVLLMPLSTCTNAPGDNRAVVTRWYCGAMSAVAMSPELAAYSLSLLPDSVPTDTEAMENIGDPSKRFVALVDWAVEVNQYQATSYFNINLATEEAVYDRSTKRWIWHALRRSDESTKSRPDIEVLNSGVQDVVLRNIVGTIANRGKQLALGASAIRWTPTKDVLKAPEEGRSRLVFFNDYNRGREREYPVTFTLRRAAEEGQPAPVGDETRFSLGYQSFAAIDVAPGKYLLAWSSDKPGEPITLAAGAVGYYRQTHGLFNIRGMSTMDKDDAADFLREDFRSGVVPDTRPLERSVSRFRFDNLD